MIESKAESHKTEETIKEHARQISGSVWARPELSGHTMDPTVAEAYAGLICNYEKLLELMGAGDYDKPMPRKLQVGGPPTDWQFYRVFKLNKDQEWEELSDAMEVDTDTGYALRIAKHPDGAPKFDREDPTRMQTYKDEGEFKFERRIFTFDELQRILHEEFPLVPDPNGTIMDAAVARMQSALDLYARAREEPPLEGKPHVFLEAGCGAIMIASVLIANSNQLNASMAVTRAINAARDHRNNRAQMNKENADG